MNKSFLHVGYVVVTGVSLLGLGFSQPGFPQYLLLLLLLDFIRNNALNYALVLVLSFAVNKIKLLQIPRPNHEMMILGSEVQISAFWLVFFLMTSTISIIYMSKIVEIEKT